MSEKDWFKGTPKSSPVLILGEVFDDRPPVTTGMIVGQKAYEGYQVYVYLDALMMTRHHPTYVDWSPLFCSLLAGLQATGVRHVLEIGSTLFATIDKLEKLCTLTGTALPDDVTFIGVEPSAFFAQVAEALHPSTRIRHVNALADVADLPSVGRSYQSTSYAFDDTNALVDYCARSVFGVHGVWFSADDVTRREPLLGKPLTLFSVSELVRGLNARGYTVEFIANSRGHRVDQFDYFETWFLCHRLTPAVEGDFRARLSALGAVTNESTQLFSTFESVPVTERHDTSFDGLLDSRRLDFTSPTAIERLEEWKAGATE